MYAIIETG
ncbi:hypothetical protein DXT76_21215, partial [Halobacillus trueperi]